MLTEEQRSSIVGQYEKGISISEIARKVGVSRHSVYRTIQSGLKEDPEIRALKKKLEKAKLEKSIREEIKPFKTEKKIEEMVKVMDEVISTVLALWRMHPDPKIRKRLKYCPYCGDELGFYETKDRDGVVYPNYECKECGKNYPFP